VGVEALEAKIEHLVRDEPQNEVRVAHVTLGVLELVNEGAAPARDGGMRVNGIGAGLNLHAVAGAV